MCNTIFQRTMCCKKKELCVTKMQNNELISILICILVGTRNISGTSFQKIFKFISMKKFQAKFQSAIFLKLNHKKDGDPLVVEVL